MSNSDYENEYRKWVASLSPKKRAELAEQGLDQPLANDTHIVKGDHSILLENTPTTDESYSDDEIPIDDTNVEERSKGYAAQLLAWVFGRLQSCRTVKSANIDRDALIFALGMATLEGRTQTEIANSYGITKAAFSARVKSWQKLLGLKPSSFMKSEQACKAYRNARLRNLTKEQ